MSSDEAGLTAHAASGEGDSNPSNKKRERKVTPIGLRPDQVAIHERMIHCREYLRLCGIDVNPRTTKHEFAVVEFKVPPVPRENERVIELHRDEIENLSDGTYWIDSSEGKGNERDFTTFKTAVVEEAMIEAGTLRTIGIRTPLSSCFNPVPGKVYTCVAIVEKRGKGERAFRVERVMPLFPEDMDEELHRPEPTTRMVAFMPGIRRDRRNEKIVRVNAVSVDPKTGKNIYMSDGYLGYMKGWGNSVLVVLHETLSRFLAIPAVHYEENPEQAAAEARDLVLQHQPEHLEPGTFYCHGLMHGIVFVLEAAVKDGLPTKEERKPFLKRNPNDEEEVHPILCLSVNQIKSLRRKLLEKFAVDKLQGAMVEAHRHVDEAELGRRTARVQLINEALAQLTKEREANSDL